MSGSSRNDPFEIVDDPSEIIRARARNNGEGSSSSASATAAARPAPPRNVPLPGDAAQQPPRQRTLPPGFSSSSSNGSSKSRALPPGFSSSSSSGRHASSSTGSRVWIPPPRPWEREMKQQAASAMTAMNGGDTRGGFVMPTIGGSGARVPTELLDSKGEFKPPPKPAIDLTADDDSDGDEPQLVKIKNGDIVSDEAKNNGPVCLGYIEATVFCMYGVPDPIAVDGPGAMDASQDNDPLWQRSNWPGVSRFLVAPGYRPVYLKLTQQQQRPQQGPTSANWSHGGSYAARNAQPISEFTVAPILSPLAHQKEQGRRGIPIAERRAVPHVKDTFGILSSKFSQALAPLVTAGLVNFESRCRIRSRASAGSYAHSCDILVFCTRPKASYIVETLAQAGVTFTPPQPNHYSAYDYNQEPPLVRPTNGYIPTPPPGTAAGSSRNFNPGMFYGNDASAYRYVQSKEMTEEERRKQIETVYDQLTAGEDLHQTEPSSLVVTTLFPHQKQGLTFLLDRERERSFEEAGDAREAGVSRSKRIDLTAADTGDLTKDTVGLWKVVRSQVDGSIRAYRNVLTQQEQEKEPSVCRGAILADDMGLGKTITVISVIASTMSEARAFGKTKPNSVQAIAEHSETEDEEEDDDGGFEGMASGLMAGAGSSKKRKTIKISNGKGKERSGNGKKAQAKDALERARRDNLDTRSRATLIVAPLTIVANWEEQIKEHWAKKGRPSVYIYHGANRSSNTKEIANHDVVLTTYSTLGSEFSRQTIWNDGGGTGGKDGEDDEDDEDDDSFEMYDDHGRPIAGSSSSTAKGKGKKRKKKVIGKEAPNPLQRIEWFRIVLDEAHTIKEVRTMQCRAVCNLSAQRRLSLTGTPVQNRLDDLYAQIKFLRLEPFSDRMVWNEHCGQRQKKNSLTQRSNANQNNEPLERIALVKVQTMMKFLTLRRTKETRTASGQKLLELPAKNVRVVTIDFDERERTKYKELHERYKEDFKEMEEQGSVGTNYATILQEISNLRICCDDPSLVDASKDNKRRLEGREGFSEAIREDGMTRERAAGLFEIYSESEEALCWDCGHDLARFAESIDTGVRGDAAAEDGSAGSRRPIVTRCTHIICSRCFQAKVPAWKKAKAIKAEDQAECPACNSALSLLTDVVQLEPADLGGDAEPDSRRNGNGHGDGGDDFDWGSDDDDEDDKKRSMTSHRFGCDRQLPIEDRVGLSHKTRWLLGDLIPFSQCNPRSLLYHADAPQIEHHTPTDVERRSRNLETVVAVPRNVSSDSYRPIKSIVFSQWTSMLDKVERALYRAGIKTVRLDGKMRRPDRAAALDRFKSDTSVEVFLISLRAGGFGLNLVSACRAYCLEPAWNPAQEAQAMDRVHRLGQTVPVISTKVVTRASIEERMLEVQKRKAELASAVAGKRQGAPGQQKTRAEEKEERRRELAQLMS